LAEPAKLSPTGKLAFFSKRGQCITLKTGMEQFFTDETARLRNADFGLRIEEAVLKSTEGATM
jgi:hypothetical protein